LDRQRRATLDRIPTLEQAQRAYYQNQRACQAIKPGEEVTIVSDDGDSLTVTTEAGKRATCPTDFFEPPEDSEKRPTIMRRVTAARHAN
jgi:hypothetical protein